MTREDVKKIFPDATDEQISSFLNQSNGDVAKEKAKTQTLKEKADKADELQKKIDEIEQQGLSDLEKMTKRAEAAETALATEKKDKLTLKITSMFATSGLTGDTYAGAIKAFSAMPEEDAVKDADAFVKGIVAANNAALETAKSNWEKEILSNTPNPGGESKPASGGEESVAAKYAKNYTAKMNPANKAGETPVNF